MMVEHAGMHGGKPIEAPRIKVSIRAWMAAKALMNPEHSI